MIVYFISGLGADKRVFQNLTLSENITAKYLEWIEPQKNESLKSYSRRFSSTIDSKEPFGIVGLSYGGMIAVEIAKELNPDFVVIISSIYTNSQLPLYVKIVGKFNLHKIIPIIILRSANKVLYWLFGSINNEEKQLIKSIQKDSDPKFTKWAMNSILKWKNHIKPNMLIHIHGTKDRILPIKQLEPDYVIIDGTHFMIFNKFEKISEIINQVCN